MSKACKHKEMEAGMADAAKKLRQDAPSFLDELNHSRPLHVRRSHSLEEANSQKQKVVRRVAAAVKDLRKVLKTDLGVDVAVDKAGVVASSPGVARLLRQKLGDFGGPDTRVTTLLGIDLNNAQRR